MNRLCKAVFALAFASSVCVIAPAHAVGTLWYNGDFNNVNGCSNERNTLITQSAIYDDFIVPFGETWNITSVFSNNLLDSMSTVSADWEIRSGVSTGNGGTLVASGNGAAATYPTGRSLAGVAEYTVAASTSVALGSGTYWLMVRPVGSGSGRSYVSTTSGLNAIGLPAGNNMNAFVDSTFWGYNFNPTTPIDSSYSDFSMGVEGYSVSSVPEGSSLAFLAAGLLPIGIGLRRRLRK